MPIYKEQVRVQEAGMTDQEHQLALDSAALKADEVAERRNKARKMAESKLLQLGLSAEEVESLRG